MKVNKKTASSALFVFGFLTMAGSAHAEYAYDCKVDWICHGPNLCEKSEKEFSLALSGDLLVLEYGREEHELEDLDLYRVEGDLEHGAVFSGLDSEGDFVVMSLDRLGSAHISTHKLPRGNSFFNNDSALLTAYLTCTWRF